MIKVMIRQAAIKKGFKNAYQFGQSIGVSRMVAARIWKNEQPPKLKTLDRICEAWGCDLGDLIAYFPKRHQEKPDSNGHTKPLPQKRTRDKRVAPKTSGAKLSGSKRSRE